MNEGLTKRVGRIVAGSLNAIIDAVEDAAPEAVMEQSIREIDDAVDEVRAELGKALAAKHHANKSLSDKNSQHEELGRKIQIAVNENRDDLAEAAIAQQLDIEAQIPILEHSITDAADQERELEGYIAALQARKREMQEELKNYREAQATVQAPAGGSTGSGGSIDRKVGGASQAFDRVMDRTSSMVSGGVGDAKTAQQMQELEELAQKNRVSERLATIKSGMDQK